jgi:hypothetical protein
MTNAEEREVGGVPPVPYSHPQQVLDADIDREEKIRILREWYYDAVRMQESTNENMTGGAPDRLQAVSKALLALGVSPAVEADPGAPENEGVVRSLLARVKRALFHN